MPWFRVLKMAFHNRISRAAFTRLWMDTALSLREIGDRAGYTHITNLRARADKFGLPPRPLESRGPKYKVTDEDLFRDMWEYSVATRDMAAHFKVRQNTILNTAIRLGLPSRPNGRLDSITIHDFFRIEGNVYALGSRGARK